MTYLFMSIAASGFIFAGWAGILIWRDREKAAVRQKERLCERLEQMLISQR